MAKIWRFGNDVDTDQIVPGRYAPYMRPNEDVGNAAFIEARPDLNQQLLPGDILVADDNFGCGSSREYAVEALKRRQVGAIIANSFARIFYRNAINLGIPLYVAPEIVSRLQEGDTVQFDADAQTMQIGDETLALPELPDFVRQVTQAGGMIDYIKAHGHFPGETA
ncbi:MAG: 3-isopropylmalate dehydratase [Anaerolineaceae bacterium]|nr:3-isopropylmalate dehydratase [Anaerolineaceae bacterium]